MQPQEEDNSAKQKKNVSFDSKQNVETNLNKSQLNKSLTATKKTAVSQNTSFNARERSRSANPQKKKKNAGDEDDEIR